MLASMYDASLDQFSSHSWKNRDVWPTYSGYNTWGSRVNFTTTQSIEKYWNEKYIEQKEKTYDALNYLPVYSLYDHGMVLREQSLIANMAPEEMEKRANAQQVVVTALSGKGKGVNAPSYDSIGNVMNDKDAVMEPGTNPLPIDQSQIQIRKNFNETAFFLPELRTDKDGNIEFSFTMPEALTQWKLMTLAHTKDLASGFAAKTVITKK